MIKIFEKNVWLSWFTVVLIGIGIFVISGVPQYSSGYGGGNSLAVFYHFFAFFFLGLFLMIACVRGKDEKFFVLAILISVLYAILDEVHQIFVPGRYCSFGDVVVDLAGILSAFVLYYLIIRFRG